MATALDQLLASAQNAARAGRRDEAVQLWQRALTQAGEQPVALNGLGMQALQRGDWTAAAAFFQRAIGVDPRAPDLWMNLAKAHRERGDAAAEQIALEGALAIDQRHFMALVRLAELHDRMGDRASAAERWSNVLAIAATVEERSPALEMMLEHARDTVAAQRADFATMVDAGLAAARERLSPDQRRRADTAIDHALGRRRIYANHCAGLHVPFLPADEFFERRHFPWLDGLEAQTAAIRAEFEALVAADAGIFTPYVGLAPGTPANKWSPLDGSLDWNALHLWKDGRRDDSVCARVPKTAAVIEALPLSDLPGRTPTVFFSILRPGAHLPAHTGVSNVRAIIHLPLVVPAGCSFRVGGETRDWEEGRAWAFDDTIEHEAWNRSDHARAILILDAWNPHIPEPERELLRRFYAVANAAGNTPAGALGVSD